MQIDDSTPLSLPAYDIDSMTSKLEELNEELSNIKTELLEVEKGSDEEKSLKKSKIAVNSKIDNLKIRLKAQQQLRLKAEQQRKNAIQLEKEQRRQEVLDMKEEIQGLSGNLSLMLNELNIEILKISGEKKALFAIVLEGKISQIVESSNLETYLRIKFAEHNGEILDKKTRKYLDFLDVLLENKLIKEVKGINFKPVLNARYFNFQGDTYYNEFEPTNLEFEVKSQKRSPIPYSRDLLKAFPRIRDIFMHWVGDPRVFFSDNLELISKYETDPLLESKLFNFLPYLKSKFGVSDPLILKSKFEKRVEFLNENPEYTKEWDDYLEYFLKWLAYSFQNDSKLPNGCAFKTVQGIGKDFAKDFILGPIFNSKYIKSLSQEVLNEKFNSYLYSSRFIIAQELEISKKTIDMHQRIKDIMTNPFVTVRDLFKSPFNSSNHANWLFFGNHQNMLRIEKTDRRFSVFEQDLKISPYTVHKISAEQLTLENMSKDFQEELKSFGKFLFNLDVKYSEIEKPIETAIKKTMQSYGLSEVERFKDWVDESFNSSLELYTYFANEDTSCEISDYIQMKKGLTTEFKYPLYEQIIPLSALYKMYSLWKFKHGEKGQRTAKSFNDEFGTLCESDSFTKYNAVRKIKERFRHISDIINSPDLEISHKKTYGDLIEENRLLKEGIEKLQDILYNKLGYKEEIEVIDATGMISK